MKKSTRLLIFALLFTGFVAGIGIYFENYWPMALGIFLGILRTIIFWDSKEEGKPLQERQILQPPATRTPKVQKKLEIQYQRYEETVEKNEFWRNRFGLIALLLLCGVIVWLDRELIFYTFFLSMLTTWMWFQWWIAARVGK